MRPLIFVADVGQGNCNIAILGKSPKGDGGNRAIVVDCGPKAAKDIPVELLRKGNVTWIDALILSHNDRDHIGGLTNLLGEFQGEIGRIFYTGDRDPQQNVAFAVIDDYYQRGLLATQPVPISLRETESGLCIFREEMASGTLKEVLIIAPTGYEADSAAAKRRANDASAIVLVRFGDSKVVFPGDAPISAWKALLKRRQQPVQADVIVVPHHGGQIHGAPLELRWLYEDATKCEYALISAGTNNRQGRKPENYHPRVDVLEALYKAGMKVICTELTPNCSHCELERLKSYRASQKPSQPSRATHDRTKIACGGTIAIDMDSNQIRFLDHPQIHDGDWSSDQTNRCPLRM